MNKLVCKGGAVIVAVCVFLMAGDWIGRQVRVWWATREPFQRAIGELPNGDRRSRTVHLRLLGKGMKWVVCTEDLQDTPSWTNREATPPPLSVDQAVARSRQGVPECFRRQAQWSVREIKLQTLGQNDKWYYVIVWSAEKVDTALEIPVLMSGIAVPLQEDD